jgi:hypothetical protein
MTADNEHDVRPILSAEQAQEVKAVVDQWFAKYVEDVNAEGEEAVYQDTTILQFAQDFGIWMEADIAIQEAFFHDKAHTDEAARAPQ